MKRRRFERRSGPCALCQTWRRVLISDHIVPRHKGGADELSNIQFICANCHQDKTEDEMRARHKDRVFSPEHRARISAGLVGREVSPETREKLSAAITGKKLGPRSLETRLLIGAKKRGSTHTPETRAQISASVKRSIAERKARAT
jgi:HNH endonuclease/NUMOD3 motif